MVKASTVYASFDSVVNHKTDESERPENTTSLEPIVITRPEQLKSFEDSAGVDAKRLTNGWHSQ